MKSEKPVEIIECASKKGDGHKREIRVFARNIHETFCNYKRCKFYGKPAQQGVCYSVKPDLVDWDRIAKFEQAQDEELKYLRKKYKGREYVKWLEALYSCAMVNWTVALDEAVRLRRDNALLRAKRK